MDMLQYLIYIYIDRKAKHVKCSYGTI